MSISNTTTEILLFSLLTSLTSENRKAMVRRIEGLHQNGSCGDGNYDTAVRRAFNKEVETAAAIATNPYSLMSGR